MALSIPDRRPGDSMQLTCDKCSRVLEYAGERPRFCSHCGSALSTQPPGSTVESDPEALTLPPQFDANAETAAPDGSSSGLRRGVPQVVGGYKLMRPLCSGGMGSVFE